MFRLCIHPNIQEAARAEVVETFGAVGAANSANNIFDKNGWPTYQAIQKLKYLDAFCHEVRLSLLQLLSSVTMTAALIL